MQITIDDSLYHDLADKVGKANVSQYIQSVLNPIVYFSAENPVVENLVIDEEVSEKVTRFHQTAKKNSSFDEVFAMLKTDKQVSIEEMNATIRQRGAGL